MASVTILSDNGATSGSAGLKTSGGNDGVLLLQTTTSGGTATTAVSISNTQLVGIGSTPVASKGTLQVGTIGYTDTGVVAGFASSVAGYNQLVFQNTSNSASASANLNISNDAGTSSSNYGEFGINSSTFTGTGSFSQAGNVYLAAATTDLVIGTYASKPIRFVVNSGATDALMIDTSGNLGFGVTPSAWVGSAKAIEMPYGAFAVESNGYPSVLNNAYEYSAGAFKYRYSGLGASRYIQTFGSHGWGVAGSGTAGNVISFTQAMTLDASGNLGLGTSSPSSYAGGNGSLVVYGGVGTTFTNNPYNVVLVNNGTIAAGLGAGILFSANYNNSSTTTYAIISGIRENATNASPAGALVFGTRDSSGSTTTERARITSAGLFLVGVTSTNCHAFFSDTAQGSRAFQVATSQYSGQNIVQLYAVTSESGINAGGTAMGVSKNGGTSRSINCAGTVNQNGADYAEYMTKCGDFTVAKGDVVGINVEGKITNIFVDAVSFCVKSTDPGLVGGDSWGTEEAIGMTRPAQPAEDATDEEKAQYEINKAAFEAALEAARQTVDRIAFCGQVPVNVTGATPGQYIIPVNDNGGIAGQAVSNPTFEQYQQAVGKVIAIEQDGRARIIVKVA